ncbi:MAG: aromatic-ring-hydroxylating dioxygenase subunit beta [Rhodococcus sp. (in: high G+C Gram-positive bacteria)]|uniref:aromatic-ring-hydroxylating dioxygenase subunit beta n=1 Tax=Rhodococcus sp. TaxID=1831 RepID=UPI003BAE5635
MTVSFENQQQVADLTDIRQVEAFLYQEARYADEHDFDAWEALWTDDALYWVPIDGTDKDPKTHMSVIYDNRNRITTRLAQLRTGKRYAQSPPSNMRRVISNIELLGTEQAPSGAENTVVGANFVLFSAKERGTDTFAGRITYRLRVVDGAIRLVGKTVVLVDNEYALPNMGFLI